MSGTEGPPPPTTLGTADDTATGLDTESGGVPTSCDDIECQDNAGCLIEDGIAGCFCDEGYVLDEEGGDTCVVDTNCIELRYLEDRCRYVVGGPPAVTLFFAIDYCSGTAMLPEDFMARDLRFKVLENGVDIEKNSESVSTVIEKDVESYVTLVLDVSDSVTGTEEAPDPDLPLLVGELRDLVQELAPAPGQPDVYVSIYLFGRFVREYVPFTRDYAALDASIAAIEADPIAINTLVNGDGTRLYDATATGIRRTQRIRDLRDAVTWGGVLTTGTVVVITDGLESTNGTLDKALIDQTLNQVISIGISEEVTANDEALREIGRDGSFLAPDPEDWAGVFDQVVSRVKEYPLRAYLFGYCTSAAQGMADVEVSLESPEGDVVPVKTAGCSFDASVFSVDPAVTCSLELFSTECDEQPCGGLTACGTCASDECCNGRQCQAPIDATSAGLVCDANQLCSASGQICADGTCQDPAPPGPGMCDPGCDPGVTYCDYDAMDQPVGCEPVLPVDPSGVTCDGAEQCESLNCRSANPDNEFVPPTCLPPALVHDACGAPGFTVCEEGSWCSGSTCEPQQFPLTTCSSAEQCRSGLCNELVSSNVCLGSEACFWAWDEKVPD